MLLLWLLVGPRLDLVAGTRVEDLVFAALAVICLVHLRRVGLPPGPTIGIAAVVAAGLVSVAVAAGRGMVAPVTAVLFAVRPFEYWIAFPAALLLLRSTDGSWRRRIDSLLAIVTVLQTLFAVLQYYFSLPVGFSHAAYSRAAGLTVGPYELGAISAALVVYWVARSRFAMAAVASVALAASISRVSLLGAVAGLVLLVGVWGIRQVRVGRRDGWRAALAPYRRSRAVVLGQAASVAAALLVVAFTVGLIHLPTPAPPAAGPATTEPGTPSSPAAVETPPPADEASGPGGTDSIGDRIATTSVLGSWKLGGELAASVPPVRTSADYAEVAYARLNEFVNLNTAAENGAEASNLVRFFRWHLILNTIDDPADVVLGLGPSFVGPSVDGSYLRMFADGGLLGLLAWALLIAMWLRRTPLWMLCVTVSVLVGALFIDIVYAQRPMVLFWILLAVAVTAPRRTRTSAAPPTA